MEEKPAMQVLYKQYQEEGKIKNPRENILVFQLVQKNMLQFLLLLMAMAILLSLYQMINMPIAGICQGAQPILSYNYGAKNYDRVRDTFKLTFKVCMAYSLTAASLILIFSPVFARVFSSDASTVEFASWAIRIYLFGGLIFGAQLVCQQSFMALGQAKRSLMMALLRKVILLIPLIYILPNFFEKPLESHLPTRLWPVRFVDVFKLIGLRFF